VTLICAKFGTDLINIFKSDRP